MASEKQSSTQTRLVAIRGPEGPNSEQREVSDLERRLAFRTAFIARFIVVREGRRSRAHRAIEEMTWSEDATAEEVLNMFREAFVVNKDRMSVVDKDLQKALKHAKRSVEYFLEQYIGRSTTSFRDALDDYVKSNILLFGLNEELPRSGGWKFSEHLFEVLGADVSDMD